MSDGMDFAALTAEQGMLRDAARRALADAVDKSALRDGAASDPAYVTRLWSVAAEMGWTGVLVPSALGGAGLGLADAAVLGEELGRALFPGPFAATAVLTATLARCLDGPGGREDVLPAIAAGGMRVAAIGLDQLANTPPASGAGPAGPCARQDIVEYPDSATHVLIIVRDGAARRALLVPAGPGIAITMRQPFDVTCPVGAIAIADPNRTALLRAELSPEQAMTLLAGTRIVTAAELVGIAAAALDLAVAWSRERRQFGAPIGSFQALKHRMADGFVLLENARAATRHAAAAHDAGGTDRSIALDVAASCAIEAALRLTADCVQVHGALGFAWEHDAHLYLKRARRLAAALGNSQSARRAIGDLLAAVANGGADELFPPLGPAAPAVA